MFTFTAYNTEWVYVHCCFCNCTLQIYICGVQPYRHIRFILICKTRQISHNCVVAVAVVWCSAFSFFFAVLLLSFATLSLPTHRTTITTKFEEEKKINNARFPYLLLNAAPLKLYRFSIWIFHFAVSGFGNGEVYKFLDENTCYQFSITISAS